MVCATGNRIESSKATWHLDSVHTEHLGGTRVERVKANASHRGNHLNFKDSKLSTCRKRNMSSSPPEASFSTVQSWVIFKLTLKSSHNKMST